MQEDLTLKILIWVLPLGFAGVVLFWLLKKPAPRRMRTPPPNVRAEFRRRRRVYYHYGLAAPAGFVAMILSYYLFTTPLPGFFGSTFFAVSVAVAGLLAFAIGHLSLWDEYRCPACERPLTDGEGWLLNQRSCPHCGADLR